MAQKPLPPPPGFRRHVKHMATKVRYVYPFAEGKKGDKARKIHEAFLAAWEADWKEGAEYKLRQKYGDYALSSFWLNRPKRHRAGRRRHQGQIIRSEKGIQRPDGSLYYPPVYETIYNPIFFRRNPLEQVWEHISTGNRYYLKVDISDAFGSVWPGCHSSFPAYKDGWNGWPFFHPSDGGLIQGAPSSPLIFDLYCRTSGFDAMLRQWAIENGCRVTRYVDDIVFSRWRPFTRRQHKTLRGYFRRSGFGVSQRKRGLFDTERQPIEFLGVSLYRGRVRPRPALFDRFKALGMPTYGQFVWMQRVQGLNELVAEQKKAEERAAAEIAREFEELEAKHAP